MTKQELTRDIQACTGRNMPTISDISKYLGVGRQATRELLDGLDYYQAGRAKKYLAADVADRIMSRRGM